MPIDFPSSPTTNQTYTYNNKIWVFNGSAWVGGTIVSLLPAGSMQMYAGAVTQSATSGTVTTTAPSGWLLANGNAVSRTTYSALFTAIGTTYGTGDGSTSFNLPSMAGRLPMGSGTGAGLNASGTGAISGSSQTARTLGQWGGEETHLLTTAELASHTHANTVSGGNTSTAGGSHNHTGFSSAMLKYVGAGGDRGDLAGGGIWSTNTGGVTTGSTNIDHAHTFSPAISNVAAGGGSRHDTIPPFVVLNFIIKT